MGRDLRPKCKQCRRIGEKLMLKGERCVLAKCAIVKRNFPPGFHGPKGKSRQSDYGMQLAEKQKAVKQYRLMEKQFRLLFEEAKKKTGNLGDNLLKLLEMRLDNVVYRMGFSKSRNQARQVVNHGLIKVNNKKVDIPSFRVKQGDVIGINKKKAKIFNNIEESLKNYQTPGWLNLNIQELTAKCLHEPKVDDIKTNINTQMIVEFYSK